jgi:hypothetical protein
LRIPQQEAEYELIVVDSGGLGGETMAEELIRAIARFSIV